MARLPAMDLILWRHAEAESGEPDLGRKLSSKGVKQARRTAEWLHANLPDNARILVSPATHAQQTARELAEISHRKLRVIDNLAPGASVEDVLRVAGWPDGKSAVVIVGHQPTLGLVTSHLLSGVTQEWTIRKGAAWWLSARLREGEEKVVLRAAVSPELV